MGRDCHSNRFDPIQVIDTFSDSVTSVVLTKTEIVAGSVDGTVRTFHIRNGRAIVDELGQAVNSVALSYDEGCVLASCLDSTIRLLDRASGEHLQEYKGHDNKLCLIMECPYLRIKGDHTGRQGLGFLLGKAVSSFLVG